MIEGMTLVPTLLTLPVLLSFFTTCSNGHPIQPVQHLHSKPYVTLVYSKGGIDAQYETYMHCPSVMCTDFSLPLLPLGLNLRARLAGIFATWHYMYLTCIHWEQVQL